MKKKDILIGIAVFIGTPISVTLFWSLILIGIYWSRLLESYLGL